MNFETIALGVVQGLTEFIPISSSGHLVLAQEIFGVRDHLFLEALNIGTFLALVVFFRRDIIEIFRKIFVGKNYKLARNIIVTALPVGVLGFCLGDLIENNVFFGVSTTVATMLILIGLVMVFLEKLPILSARKDGEKLSWKRALGIGGAQVLSLIPGSSRSGTTIIGGRIAGLSAREAARYSFLVAIPVMAGLMLKMICKDTGYMASNWENVLVGNIFAFIAGALAIRFLLDYLGKHDLKVFGWYRIILGLVVLGLTLL